MKKVQTFKFHAGNWAGVFIWEYFQPGYQKLNRKNHDLANWATPLSYTNTSKVLQRKPW